jgi:FkbM family methyltransferase
MRWFRPKPIPSKISYSQCGEDLIVEFLLSWLGIAEVTYLDLGANDPIRFNNTYRLYTLGHRGVLVEADNELFDSLRRTRPLDTCVNSAVGVTNDVEVAFYKMTADTLSTTKGATAEMYEQHSGHRVATHFKVPNIHINDLLKEYFGESCPTFVSLDVEGLDLDLLESWDFSRYAPPVLCVETLTYAQDRSSKKIEEIFILMEKKGYIRYADTFINSIFVRKESWENRVAVLEVVPRNEGL